jgi:quinol monooxygenase YgiN
VLIPKAYGPGMIVVSGTINIDPSNNEKMQTLLDALVSETLEEAGCVSYGMYLDHRVAGSWRVFEEWATEDEMNAHMVAPHLATFMGAMGDLGVTGVELNRYDVGEKSKLM